MQPKSLEKQTKKICFQKKNPLNCKSNMPFKMLYSPQSPSKCMRHTALCFQRSCNNNNALELKDPIKVRRTQLHQAFGFMMRFFLFHVFGLWPLQPSFICMIFMLMVFQHAMILHLNQHITQDSTKDGLFISQANYICCEKLVTYLRCIEVHNTNDCPMNKLYEWVVSTNCTSCNLSNVVVPF